MTEEKEVSFEDAFNETEDVEGKEESKPETEESEKEAEGETEKGEESGKEEEDVKEKEADIEKPDPEVEKLLQRAKSLYGKLPQEIKEGITLTNEDIKNPEELAEKYSTLQEKHHDWIQQTQDERLKKLEEKQVVEKKEPDSLKETVEALEDDEDFKTFMSDFPEGGKALLKQKSIVEKIIAKKVEEAVTNLTGYFAPIAKTVQETAVEKHFNAIRSVHQDFDELQKDEGVMDWINEQPSYKKEAYLKVYQHGNAADVIDFFNDYKQAKGISINGNGSHEEEGKPEKKIDKSGLAVLEGVKSKRGVISLKAGKADKNDYMGAWNEAPD